MEVVKKVDKQGRLVLPREWRREYLVGDRVLLRVEGSEIRIRPYKSIDLTKYFDAVEVDISSDISEWREVKKELMRVR